MYNNKVCHFPTSLPAFGSARGPLLRPEASDQGGLVPINREMTEKRKSGMDRST